MMYPFIGKEADDESREKVGLAVWHQLHCLVGVFVPFLSFPQFLDADSLADVGCHSQNAIRHEYYSFLDVIHRNNGTTSSSLAEEQYKKIKSNPKVQECFDYLRVSLMCLADTNIEHFSNATRKISGWGGERVCRDVVGLLQWANKHAWKRGRREDFI